MDLTTQPSEHASVREAYAVAHQAGLSNTVDRFVAQGPRCNFCEQGVRCAICSQGPCRILPRANRGACGIDADGLTMRNLIHLNIMGISAYSHHEREVAHTLIATGKGQTPFTIQEPDKLAHICEKLGLSGDTPEAQAVAFGEAILEEMNRDYYEESRLVEIFAPESRKALWRELGVFPGGPLAEIQAASTRTMTNIDGDYLSLAKTGLRLGVSNAYGVLVPLELGQDVLFGVPRPHTATVDLGVLDPDYVNLLPNGHMPFVGFALVEAARKPENQERARAAGAKGLRIVGSIETGQEMMQRLPVDDVFVGLTGNWIVLEYALATGAVDLVVADMNCTPPHIKEVTDKFGAEIRAVSEVLGVLGVEHLDYRPQQVADQAQELIDLAIANFGKRKSLPHFPVSRTQEIMTGFSVEAILDALGGSLEPLLKALTEGQIRGVAALVSCTTLKNGPHDAMTVGVAKELIKRDVLVLSAGCGNAATQVAGLNSLEAQNLAGPGLQAVCQALGVPPVLSFGTCTDTGRLALLVGAVADALGVDPSQLPVVVTAPEYMEQKATIDALSALALGLYTHVSPIPNVTGSATVAKLLTEDLEGITGGKLALADDPVQAVEGLVEHIDKKRKELGLSCNQ
ncbi:MAG: anaerobic carbon-monoxide dehydrogenase catalytic subunit [candidate division WS1 bacterium]|nr:anaerobic carbon-monoxide dehydrogenase catalytic subunit [candidate division WS1 bacterium]